MLLCVWAVVGRINENVYGGGVITCQLQYRSIYSPSSGTLVALDVHEGSTIHMGQLVGRVFSNDDIEEFLNASKLLQYQEEVFEVIKKQVMEIKKQQTAFSDEELKCLDACIKRSEEQLKWYKKYLEEKIPTLAESGAVSQVYVMELHETNNSRMRDYEQYQADKIKQKVSLTKTIYDLDCTLGDYETSVKRVRFEMEQKLHAILYRSRIISYCNGQVTNINVNNGDFIQKGME